MIILRRLFSKSDKEKDEDNKKDKIKSALAISSGGAAVLSADKLSNKIIDKQGEKYKKSLSNNLKDSKKLNEKLIQKAKDWGVKVTKSKGDSSSYMKETDSIKIGDYTKNNPATLAHELGHAAMKKKGRSKDIIGKAAHTKLGDISRGTVTLSHANIEVENKKHNKIIKAAKPIINADLFVIGAGNGRAIAEKENSGDKKGARKQVGKSIVESALITAPMLIQEGAASRKGLKLLKESGANKESMKAARKSLGHAFGTYLGGAAKPTLITAGGTSIGYGAEKLIHKKNKDKNKDDNTKK